jgi:hypothetical protein
VSLEPIGIVTLLVGFFCLMFGTTATIGAAAVGSVFGAAAAFTVGAANIQPGHLLLGFVFVSILVNRRETQALLMAVRPCTPGFWFVLLVIYGVLTAYFMPRLFAGTTNIIPLGSTDMPSTGGTLPLGPVSSNLTQSIYVIGGLLCFAMTSAAASTPRGFERVFTAILAYCIANILFALIDIGTTATGTANLLRFMRNAQYTLHTDDQVAGMKRIVGSFTEASVFARSTLGAASFSGTLWLCGIRRGLTGTLAASSLAALVLSTSSTGLGGFFVVAALLYATALSLFGRTAKSATTVFTVVFVPLIAVTAVLVVAITPSLSTTAMDYLNLVIFNKSVSDSGIERDSWNAVAAHNIIDSYWLGLGIGTVRASSFIIALLASVGIPGALLYGTFLWGVLRKKGGQPGNFSHDVHLAARNGCLGLLLGDMLAGPVVDQGVIFYMMAALATATPEWVMHGRGPGGVQEIEGAMR